MGVAIALAMVMGLAPARGQDLPAVGDGPRLWLVTPESDRTSFQVLYHRQDVTLDQFLQVGAWTGRPAKHGLAAGRGRLWVVYDTMDVQSLRWVGGTLGQLDSQLEPGQGQGTATDQIDASAWQPGDCLAQMETALPKGLQVDALAADQEGLWALVQVQTPAAWRSIEELGWLKAADPPDTAPQEVDPWTTTEPASAPATAPQALPVPPALPVPALLRLQRAQWKRVNLPDDWPAQGQAWVLMAGADQSCPTLVCLWGGATLGQPARTQVRMYQSRQIGTSLTAATAPGLPPAASGPATAPVMAAPLAWEKYDFQWAGVGAAQALSVGGQVIVGQRANRGEGAPGVGVTLTLLRPEAAQPLGMLALDQVRSDAAWTLAPQRGNVALLAQGDKDHWAWAALDLQGRVAHPATDLTVHPSNPVYEKLRDNIMMVVILAATAVMFLFWRRDPAANRVALPKGVEPADLNMRALAALIDLAPCVVASFSALAPDWVSAAEHWPGLGTNWLAMVPGAVAIALFVVYCTFAEMFTAQTLGKRLMGLRVTNLAGQPPHVWQVLGRNLLKALDLMAWLLLILPIIGPYRQRLGDLVARTLVVMNTPPRQPQEHSDDDEED